MRYISWKFAVITLTLALCGAVSRAATNPLNNPRGLAIAANGNLYVANYGANEVLVFNPSYTLIQTIKQGISAPTGVAFDPYGNLRVSNYGGGGSVTEYGPYGVQKTAGTITNSILGPNALAVDGLGDIWVENDYLNITLYDSSGTLLKTFTPQGITSPYGVASLGARVAFGGGGSLDTYVLRDYFENGGSGLGYGLDGFAIAFDSQDNFYASNFDGTVWYATPTEYAPFVTLGYTATGIAVDNLRGRVYFANQNADEIQVYSTTGKLLYTIQ